MRLAQRKYRERKRVEVRAGKRQECRCGRGKHDMLETKLSGILSVTEREREREREKERERGERERRARKGIMSTKRHYKLIKNQ